ncbi:MAG: outer membrane protein assembly factor BamA [Puniceicoccaceae bacterium]|nr:MAG: outer membrane protein assembly factor BamA [Puniceicoccaceae bacterium]
MAAPLAAQFDSEEQPVIREIIVQFSGLANVTEEVVRSNMALREGQRFDDLAVDRDIRSLYRTGLFDFIEVRRAPAPNGQVDLIFDVRPKFRVAAVRYEGNQRIRSRRLQRETTIRANMALNERQVKNDAESIFDYYQKRGFSEARVEYSIERNPATGLGTVVFQIEEGERVRVRLVEFSGNDSIRSRTLRRQMETRRWHLFSWLTGKGRFKDDEFEDDLDSLRDYYRERGFLDVEVDAANVTFEHPSPSRMVITIPIREGRRYEIGEITISGNELYPTLLLRALLRISPGDVFVPSRLDEEVERMQDFYGQFGYMETFVRLQRIPNLETGAIDVEFQIEESERYFVESIKIEGNTKTKSVVIVRELALSPGTVFDSVRMKASQMRLENTRYFEDVRVSPESTTIPNRKNLKVTVREGRTGNLTFGAGFSSLERAVAFVELTQSNFDLFNYRSFFQGGGQKFRLKAQIGSRSSEVVLAFEEPWLFQQQLAFGFQVYRASSDFVSPFYDELRYGFEVYFRRRLIELIDGRISYRYEVVDIFNISPQASPFIQALAGKRSVSKVGLILLRDTRDSLITTTRGSRYEFITEVAGGPLGGDVDYYRLEGRAAKYFPLFEFQRQVVEVIGRLGVVKEFGDSETVPFFDRYFLGGPNTLRGFEFRSVGPKGDFGETIGGKSYGFFSVEYSLDVVEPLRFALFYDAGFVNSGAYDFNPGSFNDNIGFGIRFFVMGSPLRLDLGIPLTGDEFNKRGNQFNFSFGSRF